MRGGRVGRHWTWGAVTWSVIGVERRILGVGIGFA